jgi:DNA-binding transcriptional ArsR family regulator
MSGGHVTMLHDPDQVIDAMSPLRRDILAALDEPDSATGLAARLGSTRQKINYHLRALERVGLVEVDELRPRRGLTERLMRRTSNIVLVDPAAFDTSGMSRLDVAGLSGVVAMATDLIRQAARVAALAGPRRERVAAASLDTEVRVGSPSALTAMLEEVAAVIARYDTGSGLRLRVATTVLPAVESP